jgi:ornithine carbamoyltransferase
MRVSATSSTGPQDSGVGPAASPSRASARRQTRSAEARSLRPVESTGARHYLSVLDLTRPELEHVLDLAASLKRDRAFARRRKQPLAGQHVALLFEKPSLRTRATFTIAVRELGGDVIEVPPNVATGTRESVEDVARNLERWVAACVVRTFGQAGLRQFAGCASRMHVVNALTDEEHPCQAIADILTLHEHLGRLRGRTIAYVGDGNNVATSLAHAAAMAGLHLHVASPAGYQLPDRVVQQAAAVARFGARLRLFTDPVDAAAGVDAVYTDTWTSMGQESEAELRRRVFAPYQVNEALMRHARPGALFMHCLPAHRGEEVTAAVFESETSVVFDQAENRLHGQKALLLMLLNSMADCDLRTVDLEDR